MKLPLEELREKYIPIEEFPERYGISISKLMELADSNKIRKAEFKAPGATRRTLHLNYEEVLSYLDREEGKNESNTEYGSKLK